MTAAITTAPSVWRVPRRIGSMDRVDVPDRQLDALLERLDRIADQLERIDGRLESHEGLILVARELAG